MNMTPSIEQFRLDIVPLELLKLPPELDGSMCMRKPSRSGVGPYANNDLDSISYWLTNSDLRQNTTREYRLHVERCLLWSVSEKGKPLSAISENDALEYIDFIRDPKPKSKWISVGNPRRVDPNWRPFRSSLSEKGRDLSIQILSILFDWWHYQGYVEDNPWSLIVNLKSISLRRIQAPSEKHGSSPGIISSVEWHYLKRALESKNVGYKAIRLKAIFYLSYMANIKPAELISLKVDSFQIQCVSEGKWIKTLTIQDRNENEKIVFLLPSLQSTIESYLAILFSMPIGSISGLTPLFPSISEHYKDEKANINPISSSAIYTMTKEVFINASSLAAQDNQLLAANRLFRGSLNWLRHALEVHICQSRLPGNLAWSLIASNRVSNRYSSCYMNERNGQSDKKTLSELYKVEQLLNSFDLT